MSIGKATKLDVQ